MVSCSSNLRFGGDPGHVDVLRHALINHFSSETDKNEFHDRTKSTNNKYEITLNNKYFSANIRMQTISVNEKNDNENISSIANDDKDIVNEDGVILVFPSNGCNQKSQKSKSENIIQSLLTPLHQHALIMNQCGDHLRLCIAVTKTDDSQEIHQPHEVRDEEEIYSERVLWCLDHGYEYIQADLSSEGLKTGFEEREKDGFARIIEAMQSTVWSCAVMHRRKKHPIMTTQPHQPTATALSVTANTTNPTDLTTCADSDGAKTNANSINSKKVESSDDEMNSTENGPGNAQLMEQDVPTSSHYSQSQDEAVKEVKEECESFETKQEEFIFDSLESIMRDATRLRQDARDNKLSDEDRRRRAADTAMKLMGLLDLDDDDDDDDSNNDN